jgi:hypothetical protein
MKVGRPVVAAAVDAGAVYLDSSGEPPFIREVFEEFGPRAERTGAVLLTAFGYDYVPGNLAGALALQAAGPGAARVQVGYFVRGDIRRGTSAGTRASVTGVLLEPGYAFRGGRIVTERTAAHLASFRVDGKKREALSIGSSEHFALPRLRRAAGADGVPEQAPLTDVGVYLGWFGRATRLVHYGLRTRHAGKQPARCAPGSGCGGPPDSAQPGRARHRRGHPLGRGGRGGRCERQGAGRGAPDRRGSLLVHRADTRVGGGQGGRRRRAARGRARPGRSLRSRPPRKRC